MRTVVVILASLVSFLQCAMAAGSREVRALRLSGPVTVDGVLSEPVWRDDLGISDFLQREPAEGTPATERTVADIAYDDTALYVAARMYDSEPNRIAARLARKDVWVQSDMFMFFVDPYYDRRSGFYFAVSAAGTLYDGTLLNDSWDDDSWDGIWDAKARIDETGWTVEMRIPFSQLRFQKKDKQVWGVNFKRTISRKNEEDYLVYTPKNEQGFVSRFVDLTGIENLSPPRRVEVIPYMTAKAALTNPEPDNPFNDGSRYTPGLGADVRVGIGSNLTFNATVNPDFGQVEVDPAVVNLSDVETFFQEKRPFFIEGSNIFEFGYGGASDNWSFNWGNPNFFYSRRVGRAPQGSLPENDYEDTPAGAQILTAAKLTGKLAGNWNVGSLLAITDREFGRFSDSGRLSSAEVEPLTYYSVSRVQKEFQEGRQGLGLIATLAHRDFADGRLRDEINSSAYCFGIDGWSFLDNNKTWVLGGWAGRSNVHGSTTRITDLQMSSRHYYQRPDADHVELDPNASSLSGYAGRAYLNKEKGNVMLNAALGVISPGFDVNDLGFMWRTDQINSHVVTGYKWTKPSLFYRSARINMGTFRTYDFGGNLTWSGFFTSGYVQYKNYYTTSYFLTYNPETLSNNSTRGGPQVINPPGWEADLYNTTDNRSPIVLGFGLHGSRYRHDSGQYESIYLSAEWKPTSNVSVEISPTLEHSFTNSQYVDTIDDPLATATYGNRYVFADLDQKTFSASLRLNWTFSPKLSLQLFGQPLVSAGKYDNFGELARPRSYEFHRYGHLTATPDGTFPVDPDGAGPAGSFELDDPNFNFKSLRGNAVLRWEFHPGSTLYFVWTQTKSDEEVEGNFRLGHSLSRLWNTKADNVFLIKFSYYWNP